MAASAGSVPGKGRDISLAALQRHDPYINSIVDVASQVALYTFGHRANEWEKTDVEGTLFVYTRSASPKHGFTIMNRLSMENRTEPITKDLDFQLQDPFLLYRNARLSIYGIWFYDKEECQRIAELMKNLTQYEQLKACQGARSEVSPMTFSSGEGREVDILQMLTKAKDEYTKALDPEPKHLSLKALFGKHDRAPCQEAVGPPRTFYHHHHHYHHHHQQQQQQREKLLVQHGLSCSLPCEEASRLSPPAEKQLCPAIRKLIVRNPEQPPPEEGGRPRAAQGLPPGPVHPGAWSAGTSPGPRSPCGSRHLLAQLQSPSGGLARGEGPRAAEKEQGAPPGPALALSGSQESSPRVVHPQELLRKLQAVQQEQQLQAGPRPALAARFPVAAQDSRSGKPSEAWVGRAAGTENPLQQVDSPKCIPPPVAPSLLVPPMVFTQPTCALLRDPDSRLMTLGGQGPPAASPNPLLPLQSWEPSAATGKPLSRMQLQEALLNLVQNDDNFLSIIYEAYLFTVTQAPARKTS
uniref:mRNA-decapping enzyme 1B isoform X2 n=1 Tax=Jaculus jaculus TaxID=51337 RepID=UPI001E1B2C94|nr:mRNA-decapping enzyme 1B isoform X2 [Jaculus jaculus]